jgi:hypothetical protein
MNHPFRLYKKVQSKNDRGEVGDKLLELGVVLGTVVTSSNPVSRPNTEISSQPTQTKLSVRLKPCVIEDKLIALEDGMVIKEEFGLNRTYKAISYFPQPHPRNANKMWYYRLELENYTTNQFKTI